jgi:UTP-glucose-1-phosphate uridylyltransferase
MLPDMLSKGCMKQMVASYERHGGNIIALEQVPMDQTHQYGVVAVGAAHGRTHELTGMVEKPKARAPRRPTTSFPAAIFSSRRCSRFSRPRRRVPAARSSSPMR